MIDKLKQYPRHGVATSPSGSKMTPVTNPFFSAGFGKVNPSFNALAAAGTSALLSAGQKELQRLQFINSLPSRQIPAGVLPSHKTKYLNDGIERKSNNLLDRNKAGSLEFTQNDPAAQPLLIEPVTETYTNKSFINTVDTQFQYFKFPPRIKGSDDLDLDFDIDFDIEQLGSDPVSGLYTSLADSSDRKLYHQASGQQISFTKTLHGPQIDPDYGLYIVTPEMRKYLIENDRTLLIEFKVNTQIKNENYKLGQRAYLYRKMLQKVRPWVGSSGGVNNAGRTYSGYGSPSSGRYVRDLRRLQYVSGGPSSIKFGVDTMDWGYTNNSWAGTSPGQSVGIYWSRGGDANDPDDRYFAATLRFGIKFLVDPNDIHDYDAYGVRFTQTAWYNSGTPAADGYSHVASYSDDAMMKVSAVKDPLKSQPGRLYEFTGKGKQEGDPAVPNISNIPHATDTRTSIPYGIIYDRSRGWHLDYRPDYN